MQPHGTEFWRDPFSSLASILLMAASSGTAMFTPLVVALIRSADAKNLPLCRGLADSTSAGRGPQLPESLTLCHLFGRSTLLTATCSGISTLQSRFATRYLIALSPCFSSFTNGSGTPWMMTSRFLPSGVLLNFRTLFRSRLIRFRECSKSFRLTHFRV